MIQHPILYLILVTILPGCDSSTETPYLYTDPITGEESIVIGRSFDGWEVYTLEEAPEAMAILSREGIATVTIGSLMSSSVSIESQDGQRISVSIGDSDQDGKFDRLEYSFGSGMQAYDYGIDGQIDTRVLDGETTVRVGESWYPLLRAEESRSAYVAVDAEQREIQLIDGSWRFVE